MSQDGRKQVLILGSGFGGLYAAIELEKWLARNQNAEVTLVNRDNFFSSPLCSMRWRRAT